jgi:hypothetical protein
MVRTLMTLSTTHQNGRIPTVLLPEEEHAFNRRYAVVFHPARGVALVYDDATGHPETYTSFRRRHGVRGGLWLISDHKRCFTSMAAYRADVAARGPRTFDDNRMPMKNPYRRTR